jgi:hypothetical protein
LEAPELFFLVTRWFLVMAKSFVGVIYGHELEVVGLLCDWVPDLELYLIRGKTRDKPWNALNRELVLEDVTRTFGDFQYASSGTEEVCPKLCILLGVLEHLGNCGGGAIILE